MQRGGDVQPPTGAVRYQQRSKLPPFGPTTLRRPKFVSEELQVLRVLSLERLSTFHQVNWHQPVGRLALIAQLIKTLAQAKSKERVVQLGPTSKRLLYGLATGIPFLEEEMAVCDGSEDLDSHLPLFLGFREQVPSGLKAGQRICIFVNFDELLAPIEQPFNFFGDA
jgi:hypothetical protein